MNHIEIEVRAGTPADVPVLLSFIRSMAVVEKLEVSATEESLREALFGESPAAKLLLVSAGGSPIGYLTYFFTFASMVGRRGLWLDDIYIDPAFRGKGIGQALMAYLADLALQNRCARFEWMVLDWNETAVGFYRRLGADVLPDWRICRLEEAQLPRLAVRLAVSDGENVLK
jgi:GNAT superfamily N-acetyltransferase